MGRREEARDAILQAEGCFAPVPVSEILCHQNFGMMKACKKDVKRSHFLSRKRSLMHTSTQSAEAKAVACFSSIVDVPATSVKSDDWTPYDSEDSDLDTNSDMEIDLD